VENTESDLEEIFEDDLEACPECWGEGVVVDCFDDICHGQDYCIHGDGMVVCHTCKGSGEI